MACAFGFGFGFGFSFAFVCGLTIACGGSSTLEATSGMQVACLSVREREGQIYRGRGRGGEEGVRELEMMPPAPQKLACRRTLAARDSAAAAAACTIACRPPECKIASARGWGRGRSV